MNDHDVLIRIEERQKAIRKDVAWIKTKMKVLPAQEEKIKTLEHIVWGALLAAIAAGIKSFWPWK